MDPVTPDGGETTPPKKEKKPKAVKAPPPGGYAKKPQLSKAERRELQEKQRAAKEAGVKLPKPGGKPGPEGGGGGGGGAVSAPQGPGGGGGTPAGSTGGGGADKSAGPAGDDKKKPSESSGGGKAGRCAVNARALHSLGPKQLFAHLTPYAAKTAQTLSGPAALNEIHPAITALGLRFADGSVKGADARCVAMMAALREVVRDYSTPPEKALGRDLPKRVDRCFQFLTDSRPHSVSMGNAKHFVRAAITNLDPDLSESAAKVEVCEEIDRFVRERVVAASDLIAQGAAAKIRESGDVVLTFGRSKNVADVLQTAHAQGKKFHVVVADARPCLDGRKLAQELCRSGVTCTYVLLNALSYVMPNVTKVFLGASAIMSNGAVLGGCGTAVVAMTATRANVPVIVTCATYKLSEKVFLDSVVSNELGDPTALARPGSAPGEATAAFPQSEGRTTGTSKSMQPRLLNLRHDLTPMKFVSMVVTEVGLIPPTAVPALLREYRREATQGDGL